jgi:hypothetical protein
LCDRTGLNSFIRSDKRKSLLTRTRIVPGSELGKSQLENIIVDQYQQSTKSENEVSVHVMVICTPVWVRIGLVKIPSQKSRCTRRDIVNQTRTIRPQ